MKSLPEILKNVDKRKLELIEKLVPGLGAFLERHITNVYEPTLEERRLLTTPQIGGISFFANHNDPSTRGRRMGISGESADNPDDQWFAACRFNYVLSQMQDNGWIKPVNHPDIPEKEKYYLKSYLVNRRIKITFGDRSIVVRPADWGPSPAKRVIDVSETALKQLGAKTDDQVLIEWVDPKTPLGPA